MKKTVAFAAEHNLFLHAHCDEEALLHLFAHDPKARIVWAHTGFTTPVARVKELLDRHPGLLAEMSYRSGITEGGQLTAEWRDLFARHSDRVLLGSDTWINERWFGYDTIMKAIAAGSRSLPADQARRIGRGNAEACSARGRWIRADCACPYRQNRCPLFRDMRVTTSPS